MSIAQNSTIVGNYDVQFGGFDKLMPNRIREILLVAVPYDSFLVADDEQLSELVIGEYLDASLRSSPRITRVSTAEEALSRLSREKFDLVITMSQSGDMDVGSFARAVNERLPNLPIVLLAFNMIDIAHLPDEDKKYLDRIFLWLGDPRIFVTIIKLMEDEMNIEHDIALSNVQAVLLIEDSVRFYSSYLPIIYAELMKQTQLLMAEGINFSHKMLRMRARPKILLASSFEEAWELYERYRGNLLGVISDIQFPHKGAIDPSAGVSFAGMVKKDTPDMPILMQSSDGVWQKRAEEVGASFINKCSPNLLKDLQGFIMRYFGFGDFVFRKADGEEIGRAPDLHSMVELLRTVPGESIEFHASRNHFSKWLMARTEFEIAYHIRPRRIPEFNDIDGLRRYLIDTIQEFIHKTRMGTIAHFDGKFFDSESPFAKIGNGSIGGKARGLAFMNFLLSKNDFGRRFPGVNITVPNTTVISTDMFDLFMDSNRLHELVQKDVSNEEIAEAFRRAALPEFLRKNLAIIAEKIKEPLAVRSSSLLEDSRTQPFAGVYKTYMLPNNNPDVGFRLAQLENAVKMVFASTFSAEAKSYLRFTTHIPDEEKMAVIVQRIAGRYYCGKKRFYPTFSGVVQSYNYYPVAPLKPEDGVAYVALGLGKTIMDGYKSLRFSPAHPQNLHQLSVISDFFNNSQREFMAVDSHGETVNAYGDLEANILSFGLEEAEADGTLAPVGSTYSRENDTVYDGISRPGARLVTFAPILKNGLFPLADILKFLCGVGMEAMASHVEVEFAVNMPLSPDEPVEFNILQIRPMISRQISQKVNMEGISRESAVCMSDMTLGNGYLNEVTDIIYVKPESFKPSETMNIADQIGRINARLKEEGRFCLLIGPGRWGSSDSWLGIPVKWNQISMSKAIVETSLESFNVDPSYGTHFFHNVTSLGIGYFTVRPARSGTDKIDWDWLNSRPSVHESAQLRHIRLDNPLDIRIDGSTRKGVVIKPA